MLPQGLFHHLGFVHFALQPCGQLKIDGEVHAFFCRRGFPAGTWSSAAASGFIFLFFHLNFSYLAVVVFPTKCEVYCDLLQILKAGSDYPAFFKVQSECSADLLRRTGYRSMRRHTPFPAFSFQLRPLQAV